MKWLRSDTIQSAPYMSFCMKSYFADLHIFDFEFQTADFSFEIRKMQLLSCAFESLNLHFSIVNV